MLPQFQNLDLLVTALTHRSALNEREASGTTAQESNERLEFLGDAVLELITTEFLFEKFPQDPEGMLTAYRSALVKTSTLAAAAQELKLGEKMYLSKGEEATGGRENESLLADTFEAVIGALYLDQSYQAVKEFLEQHLFVKFKKIKTQRLYKDPKSLLQETVQAQGSNTPIYQVVSETGPDHD
ncbi:MAG: ribonuclease III, partial [Candidatus Pacebacteria bacterium]|nr:ribonuclease III [Candidatus Paceibacterota bacterium]